MDDRVTFTLDVRALEEFCTEMARRRRRPAQNLAALTELQTLLALHCDAGQQSRPAYAALRATLERHLAAAREAVMAEHADTLKRALERREAELVGPVHTALSRSGFQEVAGRVAETMEPALLAVAASWVAEWYREVRTQAEAASPYPDAIDLRAIDITPELYVAMGDLRLHFMAAGVLPAENAAP